MGSQETLKAWTLSTNFLHLRWLNAKSLNFTQCQLQQPSVRCGWLPSGMKRGSSVYTKHPQNGTVLTWLSLTTSDTKTGDLIPNIAGIRKKAFLKNTRPYHDGHNSFKGTVQCLCQQSPGMQGLFLGKPQQWAKTYDVLWAITCLVKIHCCTMQQSLLKASQPWRENAILSHWQRSYGEERGRAKGVSPHRKED